MIFLNLNAASPIKPNVDPSNMNWHQIAVIYTASICLSIFFVSLFWNFSFNLSIPVLTFFSFGLIANYLGKSNLDESIKAFFEKQRAIAVQSQNNNKIITINSLENNLRAAISVEKNGKNLELVSKFYGLEWKDDYFNLIKGSLVNSVSVFLEVLQQVINNIVADSLAINRKDSLQDKLRAFIRDNGKNLICAEILEDQNLKEELQNLDTYTSIRETVDKSLILMGNMTFLLLTLWGDSIEKKLSNKLFYQTYYFDQYYKIKPEININTINFASKELMDSLSDIIIIVNQIANNKDDFFPILIIGEKTDLYVLIYMLWKIFPNIFLNNVNFVSKESSTIQFIEDLKLQDLMDNINDTTIKEYWVIFKDWKISFLKNLEDMMKNMGSLLDQNTSADFFVNILSLNGIKRNMDNLDSYQRTLQFMQLLETKNSKSLKNLLLCCLPFHSVSTDSAIYSRCYTITAPKYNYHDFIRLLKNKVLEGMKFNNGECCVSLTKDHGLEAIIFYLGNVIFNKYGYDLEVIDYIILNLYKLKASRPNKTLELKEALNLF